MFAAYRAMRLMKDQKDRKFVILTQPTSNHEPTEDRPSFRNFRAVDFIAAGKIVKPVDERMKIYVSGTKFYANTSTFTNYPDTLLGSSDRESHYSKQLCCYFFDRNRKAFKAILNWYTTGILECPKSMEVWEFERELHFFRINAKNGTVANPPVIHKIRPNKNWPDWQRKIYYVVAEPGDDLKSKVWAVLDTLFILCSIVFFVAETEPYFKETLTHTESLTYAIFFWGDSICVTFFLFDFIVRMLVWPHKPDFFKSLLNWLDFLAILPFFVMITTNYLTVNDDHTADNLTQNAGNYTAVAAQVTEPADKGQIVALKVLRLMRVIRLLKLAKHSEQLVLIMTVVRRSGNEMSIMALLWIISTITFGSIMFYAEGEHPDTDMPSITASCWWTIATMSTVGYGDKAPKTNLGRCLGSCVVLVSMIFMALPMTLIVGKFSAAYDEMSNNEEGEEEGANVEDKKEENG